MCNRFTCVSIVSGCDFQEKEDRKRKKKKKTHTLTHATLMQPRWNNVAACVWGGGMIGLTAMVVLIQGSPGSCSLQKNKNKERNKAPPPPSSNRDMADLHLQSH